jgi:hypothetical protein
MIKKTFLFLFLSIFTVSVWAQFGTLTVSSNTYQKFWLFIDDVLQNEYATHSIRIQGLQFIPYKVRVEMDNQTNNCVGQSVLITNMPNNNNYVVNMDRSNNYLFSKTKTPANPFFIQNVILPNYSYYSAYQQFLFPGFNPNVNYGQGGQYKGNPYKGYPQNIPGGGHGHGGNQGPGNPGYGIPGYGNPGPGTPPPPPPPSHNMCMPAMDFNRAVSVIQNESFENSKFSTAKQVTTNNSLCVVQITQICRLFSFEQTKLDYAKFAYRYCVDQNNYYMLNEVFSFAASKDELRRFIEGR